MCQDNVSNIIAKRLSEAAPDHAGFALAELLLSLEETDLGQCEQSKEDGCVDSHRSYPQTVLVGFVVKALLSCEVDRAISIKVVHLCVQREFLLNVALSHINAAITQAVAGFVDRGEFAVPVAPDTSEGYLGLVLRDHGVPSSVNSTTTPQNTSVRASLEILKVFVQLHVNRLSRFHSRLVIVLALLAGVKYHDISDSARHVVLALISASGREPGLTAIALSGDSSNSLRSLLWQRVSDFTSHSSEPYYTNIGLSIWLRLLTVPSTPWLSIEILIDDSYWSRLHLFLAGGSSEQRKISLAILRQSIALLNQPIDSPYMKYDPDLAVEYQTHYDRYATVFETIILARYLNQVQECLPDLLALCKTTSLLHPAWMVTLLHASLLHGMQDSIRNLLGPWILQNAANILSSSVNSCGFLEYSFLHWATLGYHCTNVTKASQTGPRCLFGERLMHFVSQTIILSANKSEIVESMLRFLASKGGRIFSFSRSFILEGLIVGVREAKMRLNSEHVSLLCSIGQQQGFQEVVRDLMILQTSELAFDLGQLDEQSASSLVYARNSILSVSSGDSRARYLEAKKFFFKDMLEYPLNDEDILARLISETGLVNHPLQQLDAWIKYSNHLCLAGSGLRAACDFLWETLQEQTNIETDILVMPKILEAMWNEAERKEFPKAIMIDLPWIFFHRKLVQFLKHRSQLASIMEKYAQRLILMSRTKIYLFAPLVAALRHAILSTEATKHFSLADLIDNYLVQPPEAEVEFDLERVMSKFLEKRAPERTYEYYYSKPEEFGHACVFDILNTLPPSDEWDQLYREVLDKILQRWLNQKQSLQVRFEWKTTAQLQVIVMAIERLTPKWSSSETSEYLQKLYPVLQQERLPRFRFLLEWAIVRIYFNVPKLRKDLSEKVSGSHFMGDVDNPKFTVSLTKIASAVACLPDTEEAYGLQIMAALSALAASQKVAVRHEAQWTFPKMWQHAVRRGWGNATSNIAFQRLNDHIRSLETFRCPPPARLLEEFDPILDHNLTYLLQGRYLMMEPSERPLVTRQNILQVRTDDDLDAQRELLALVEIQNAYQDRASTALEFQSIETGNNKTPLQTKSTVTDVEKLDGVHQRQSNNVIVVASLIDSPYNLGGISRASEIFGVKSLKVKSTAVTKNKDFTSVSVASHLWFPVEELKIPEIAEYLRQCKIEGYKVVGIEQTDSSLVLGRDECKLPKDVVFVLGSEKEGIPADLLSETQLCVEIQQAGITRSMNVQTALSVALYEHQRQHH